MDFEDFLQEIEINSGDFMFLDPPYDTEFSDYDGRPFGKDEQARLAEVLKHTPAKFLLIIKNTDYIRSLYENDFYIHSFDKQYSYNVRSRNQRDVEHLVITNYSI
jgi:DNA adenine methylase